MTKRLSELERRSKRAVQALKAGEWWDGKRWRPKGIRPRTAAEGKAYRTPHDVLAEVTSAALGGSGECVMTERPSDHMPLYDRVALDGTVVASCVCAGCEAARKCKCSACLAAQRFGRSAQADRDERSASTVEEIEADAIFEAARPYLLKKPYTNRSGFSSQPAKRTAWTALARYISAMRGQDISPNRLRMICRQRGEK